MFGSHLVSTSPLADGPQTEQHIPRDVAMIALMHLPYIEMTKAIFQPEAWSDQALPSLSAKITAADADGKGLAVVKQL